jgi:hypothetical protein
MILAASLAAMANAAAVLFDAMKSSSRFLPALNYQRSSHTSYYWGMLLFNSPVTKYR